MVSDYPIAIWENQKIMEKCFEKKLVPIEFYLVNIQSSMRVEKRHSQILILSNKNFKKVQDLESKV